MASRILVAQDVLTNRVHAFVAEQHFDAWIATIAALETRPYDTVLFGHGLPGDRRLYPAMRAYLGTARTAFAEASGPDDLMRRVEAAYPDYGGSALLPLQNFFLFPNQR